MSDNNINNNEILRDGCVDYGVLTDSYNANKFDTPRQRADSTDHSIPDYSLRDFALYKSADIADFNSDDTASSEDIFSPDSVTEDDVDIGFPSKDNFGPDRLDPDFLHHMLHHDWPDIYNVSNEDVDLLPRDHPIYHP